MQSRESRESERREVVRKQEETQLQPPSLEEAVLQELEARTPWNKICKKLRVSSKTISAIRKEHYGLGRGEAMEEEEEEETRASSSRLTLSDEQTRRVYAISHLEGGMDPSEIIDDLLDNDAVRRNEFPNLSLSDEAQVIAFLKIARSRGWKNDGKLIDLISSIRECGIVEDIPRSTLLSLIELATELRTRGWDIKTFVDEATRAHNIIFWYGKYRRGELSSQSAIYNLERALME